MRRLAVGLLSVILLGGCSSLDIRPSDSSPAPPGLAVYELKDNFCQGASGLLRFRQTARFTFRGRNASMFGMMELDPGSRRARLVAVNELGIKLFDLEVAEEEVIEHFVIPELSRFPRFGEAVATSLLRIFLAPCPMPGKDRVTFTGGRYLVSGKRGEGTVHFLFGESHAAMIEKSMTGRRENWRVIYRDHRRFQNRFIPYDMVLIDKAAAYRLELKITDVRAGYEHID
ncbi:MAG: DUF3261 domain-containing protein [Desulfuromonadaceae bacterium]|nr:DUF3261 domain-containing protein [Desulfuromonadaceae bacterium]